MGRNKKLKMTFRESVGQLYLSRSCLLPSRLPLSDREVLLVIRGEEEWLIKNLSLVFSSVSYTGAQPVSFSLSLSLFRDYSAPERGACAHTRWLTAQRWAKLTEVREIAKFPTAGSQSAHKILSHSREDAVSHHKKLCSNSKEKMHISLKFLLFI